MLQNNPECKILCFCEHWKSMEQLEKIKINNFRLQNQYCREAGQHGGVAIYVEETVKTHVIEEFNKLSETGTFECAAIQCQFRGMNIVVIVIYRPPSGNIVSFFSKMEHVLTYILSKNMTALITGDFNIELLKDNKNKSELMSLMYSFNFVNTIKENTRITEHSSSCIDNIFTNMNYIKTCVFESHISDHTAQKIVFKIIPIIKNSKVYKRSFTETNKKLFLESLSEQNWASVYEVQDNDTDIEWCTFHKIYSEIFNQHFPLKLVSIKNKKKHLYDNPLILEHKKKMDILLPLSKHYHYYKELYKKYKKQYDILLKQCRAMSYQGRVEKSDNKVKCMWSICKEIIGNNKDASPNNLNQNGQQMVETFNEHLLSIVPNLLQNLPSGYSINTEINNKSMFLRPITPQELIDINAKIKNKHSSGNHEIPTSLIKLSTGACQDVLCYLINSSFKSGIFPQELKTALIKPIHKKGDPKLIDNYRPISLLPGFSKLFELAMLSRMMFFIKECNLIRQNQHGYLKGKSTQTAIFEFVRRVLEHMEVGELALGMFLDLSKAYDCLDRELLLRKLERYGFRGKSLEWLQSYLNNRKQQVSITNEGKIYKSQIRTNNIGIAQGSILGPVLFLLFLNDLNLAVNGQNQNIINYADDTNLLIGKKHLPELIDESKILLDNVSRWFNENNLILNSDKTNVIIFRTKLSRTNRPLIYDSTKNILISDHTKFLGIIIDEHLDWSNHIEYLLKKLGSVCYAIRVISKYMDERTLKTLYYSNFQSVMSYGIIFWGSNSKIQRLFVTQKRVIRTVRKMNFNESCRGIFKSEKIMTVYALYIYECLVYFYMNRECFESNIIHQYNTRKNLLNYPAHKLAITEKSPLYMCLKFYNELPLTLRLCGKLSEFKFKLKNYLLNIEPYSLPEFFNFNG